MKITLVIIFYCLAIVSTLSGLAAFIGSVFEVDVLSLVPLLIYLYIAWPTAVIAFLVSQLLRDRRIMKTAYAVLALLIVLPFAAELSNL
ncbi:MAG: hypothetical protein R3E64_00150 [Halioglobus sp.]